MKALEAELAGGKERDALANEKHEVQKVVEELKQQVSEKGAELEKERQGKAAGAERVKVLEAELVGVKGERDALANEKHEVQKVVEELKQQVSEKGAELEKERQGKAAGAERVKALEVELVGVKGERDACLKEKYEVQKVVEELKQQVSEKGAELEKERQGKAAGAERVKALEVELVGVKGSVMRV